MKRLLVTGGAGFIGSNWVRLALQRSDLERLIVFDKLTYAGNLANLAGLDRDPRFRFVQGDIADPEAVRRVLESEPVDAIVNFAAESHVDRSVLDPSAFLRTNVHGVYVLLEACRAFRPRRFLHVSTDEVYGEVLSGRSTERDPVAPRSPYAAAKAAGDLLALSYHVTYGLDVVITRGANTIGPYQYPEKAAPLFITNAIEGQPLPIYGDGTAIRDYLYVEDHCRAIMLALEAGQPGEVYNIGNNEEITTLTLADAILSLLNRPRTLIRFVEDRPGHDRRYAVDSSKLRALGWHPQHDFRSAIAATVEWYQQNTSWWRPIRTGEFREFYLQLYGRRLGLSE
ncbi:MAG: dTDP-glucose 4,6-dehydratase [Chloroflexota bacterium]|nr:dTDP-glucose 4,6-dehydratase [Dehalococcoidia bacterium]MDW8252886.1 dTDP-glucose 4,6-dehydratase [Chloroflexota bacterium]